MKKITLAREIESCKTLENLEAQESSEQIEDIQELQDSINFEVEETQASIEEREISTEAIWGEIAGLTIKGQHKRTELTIKNLLRLTDTDFRKGKIEENEKRLRDYLNQIFENEAISVELKYNSPKELIEKAKEAIEQLANEGKLIDAERSETTEEVWSEISGLIIKGKKLKRKVTFDNLLKLGSEEFRKGKIIETGKLLREYLNKIFEIEGIDIEIKSNSLKEEIDKARAAIEQLATEGKLGTEAQIEVENEIKTTEELWIEIARKTLIGQRQKRTELTIKNLLRLTDTDFTKGKIEENEKRIREYINKIFEIEGIDIKINSTSTSTKELIEEAKKAIRELALDGKLGTEEQIEVENEIKTTEEVWSEIARKTLVGTRQKDTKIKIKNLLNLSDQDIKKGKIEENEKRIREYINKIFEIEGIDIKINSNSTKELIERAKKAIEGLAIRGSFGELEKKEYIKSEIEEKQKEIQTLILEKINSIPTKPKNINSIEFDSMEEYVIGEILEKYVTNENGEPFRLETNKTFQVEIEKNNNAQNPRLDFLISTEFTTEDWENIVIEWHPFRLDWVIKILKDKIEKEDDPEKKVELQEKLEKVKNRDVDTITNLEKEYSRERQELAEQILPNDITIVETFQEGKDIEGLYKLLEEDIITNSNFPETQEEFRTEFNNIYIQISTIQEMKKQRIARIEIEKYLETNQVDSIEELTNEQITKLWKKRFKFLRIQNRISKRIKNSETHTKKEDQETQIQYKRSNLIAFYNCNEYKLKDEELEAHIDQKIEKIRSEISALESILEPEQELEEIQETRELHTEDTQAEELVEPVQIYQDFQLTSY